MYTLYVHVYIVCVLYVHVYIVCVLYVSLYMYMYCVLHVCICMLYNISVSFTTPVYNACIVMYITAWLFPLHLCYIFLYMLSICAMLTNSSF